MGAKISGFSVGNQHPNLMLYRTRKAVETSVSISQGRQFSYCVSGPWALENRQSGDCKKNCFVHQYFTPRPQVHG
jgi:hypothetical protein